MYDIPICFCLTTRDRIKMPLLIEKQKSRRNEKTKIQSMLSLSNTWQSLLLNTHNQSRYTMSIANTNILFVIIFSYRIEQALHKNTIQDITSSAERNSIVCKKIISAVNMHRRAIKFVINDSFFIENFFATCDFSLILQLFSMKLHTLTCTEKIRILTWSNAFNRLPFL